MIDTAHYVFLGLNIALAGLNWAGLAYTQRLAKLVGVDARKNLDFARDNERTAWRLYSIANQPGESFDEWVKRKGLRQ